MDITKNVRSVNEGKDPKRQVNDEGSGGKNPKGPKKPVDWKDQLKKFAIGMVVVMVIFGGAIGIKTLFGSNEDTTPPATEVRPGEGGQIENPSDNKPQERPEETPEAPEEPTVDDSKNNLVNPNAPIEDPSEGQEHLQDWIDKLEEDPDPKSNKSLRNPPTKEGIIKMIETALNLGYTPDVGGSLWFHSSRENTDQFVVALKKDGASDLVLSGNFINTIKGINVEKFEGNMDLSDLISPGDTPQATE